MKGVFKKILAKIAVQAAENAGIDLTSNCKIVHPAMTPVGDKVSAYDIEVHKATFYNVDGGYTTYYENLGCFKEMKRDDVVEALQEYFERYQNIMGASGIGIDFMFKRDGDLTERELRETLAPARVAAKKANLEVDFLFEARIQKLASVVVSEGGLLSITTSIYVLNEKDRLKLQEARKAKRSALTFGEYTASPDIEWGSALYSKHRDITKRIISGLSKHVNLKLIKCEEAARKIRQEACFELTDKAWAPIFWGKTLHAKFRGNKSSTHDMSHLLVDKMGVQLFPAPAYRTDDASIIRVGKRYIAPLYMHIFPSRYEGFGDLVRVIGEKLPFRYNLSIETGNEAVRKKLGTKKTLANLGRICDPGGGVNNVIADSCKHVLNNITAGETGFFVRLILVTWGDNLVEAQDRKKDLIDAMGNWGGAELRDSSEDPAGLWMESFPGIARTKISQPSMQSSSDLALLMPIDRSAPIWTQGPLLLRSDDGRLIPLDDMSSVQAVWNAVTIASPGSGKTVAMMARIIAKILSGLSRELPYVTFLDVGFSTVGLIAFIKSILPKDEKDLAVMHRMTLDRNESINPFDIMFGLDRPTEQEKRFAVSFTRNILAGPSGVVETYMSDVANKIVDIAYARAFDAHTGAPYIPSAAPEINQIIEKHKLKLPNNPRWFEVRDILFENGYETEAQTAHRLSMPTYQDCVSFIPSEDRIKTLCQTEDNYLTVKNRISSACDKWPNISVTSKLNFGRARIIAFDMRQVIGDKDEDERYQTRMMYLLAEKAGGGHYWLRVEDIKDLNVKPLYESQLITKISEIQSLQKSIIFEEFFQAAKGSDIGGEKNAPVDGAFSKHVEAGMSVARKSNISYDVVSQQLQHISDGILKVASTIYVLSPLTENDLVRLEGITEIKFDVLKRANEFLSSTGFGGNQEGSKIVLFVKDKKQRWHVKFTVFTLPAVELWCLTSTSEDNNIQSEMNSRHGFSSAVQKLAEHSDGTLKDEYLKFKALLNRKLTNEELVSIKGREVEVFCNLLDAVNRARRIGVVYGDSRLDREMLKIS